MTKLKVLTLNCWDIPYFRLSKDNSIRIKYIGEKIATDKYDIVALQEIWSEDDFNQLQIRLIDTLPYSHYFHSGAIGSGVCIFSRYALVGTLMHRYSLNGYAHHIHRGDWFGGKVVALVKIIMMIDENERQININVYATHIHAEYHRTNDRYLTHRTLQAFELANFVRQTSDNAHICLLLGDLNLEPIDLGFKLILDMAELKDAWIEKQPNDIDDVNDPLYGMTSDRPDNCYTPDSMKQICTYGKRIDYILYRYSTDLIINVTKCQIS